MGPSLCKQALGPRAQNWAQGPKVGPEGPGPKNMFYDFLEGLGASWDLGEHFWDFRARAKF